MGIRAAPEGPWRDRRVGCCDGRQLDSQMLGCRAHAGVAGDLEAFPQVETPQHAVVPAACACCDSQSEWRKLQQDKHHVPEPMRCM